MLSTRSVHLLQEVCGRMSHRRIVEGKAGDKDVCVVTSECIDCGGCEDACETEPKALGYKD